MTTNTSSSGPAALATRPNIPLTYLSTLHQALVNQPCTLLRGPRQCQNPAARTVALPGHTYFACVSCLKKYCRRYRYEYKPHSKELRPLT